MQSALDVLKAEVAKANRRLGPKFGSPLTPGTGDPKDFLTPATADEDDVFTTGGASTNRKRHDTSAVFQPESFEDLADVSPDPSPSRPFHASNHPNKEIEALQQRLFHAERQIKTLKGSLHREKEMRLDYKRKLEASPGYIHDENEPPESEPFEDIDAPAPAANTKPRHKLTPFRYGGGRGRRGRGSISLSERFEKASRNLSPNGLGIKSPPLPSIPVALHDQEDGADEFDLDASDDDHNEEEDVQQRGLEISPLAPVSNRTSVDGMDPAFANVLRKSASYSSFQSSASPRRQSVLSRSGRGGAQRRQRGGAAFQEARPPSLVGQPEALSAALSAELGVGMTGVIEDDILDQERETKEVECQTDEGEITLLVPTLPSVTTEVGVQVEAGTVSSATTHLVTSDMFSQTDEVVIQHTDTAVQHLPSDVNTQAGIQTSPFLRHTHHPVFSPTPRRTTLMQSDFSKSDDGSGDLTVRNGRMPGSLSTPSESAYESESDIDDGATETGAETETDADDYEDARMSIGMTTPSESREDFHSMLTISDNDYSESDEESIKVSRISSRAGWSSVASFTEQREMYEPEPLGTPVEYDEKGVGATFEEVTVVEVIKEIEVIKVVEIVKEVEVVKVVEVIKEVEVLKEIEKPFEVLKEIEKPIEVVKVVDRPVEIIKYVEKPVEVEVIKYVDKPVEVEVTKYVEQPKPEVKEMSIQTDTPRPVTPPTVSALIPSSTPSSGKQDVSSSSITPLAHAAAPGTPMGLYKVGTGGQQFQFVTASPPASPSPTSGPSSPVTTIRDSVIATFNMIHSRVSHSEQRKSTESAISVVAEDLAKRSRTPSNVPSVVDKTRPPTMALPPPPRQPPPPSSMLPPSFIPERRFPTTSSASDVPPPRPSSPPPPELIQRATTPTFGAMLSVNNKGSYGPRQHGSSMPPSSNIRQPPSTSSFRSAANAAAHAQNSQPPSGLPSWSVREKERRELSSTSLASDRSALSPRSSMSSDHNPFVNRGHTQGASATSAQAVDQSTDPTIIHAITQTMIGEFLYKYTRRAIGKGHGEKRHKRFFWVHPYTKTLYWSSADPGSSNVSESSAKSGKFVFVRGAMASLAS